MRFSSVNLFQMRRCNTEAKTMASAGDYKGEIGDTTIRVSVDKKKKTIKVSDSGIGMTKEEVDKYLNQIAFSSANDFLDKYKDQSSAIIGHFGSGFLFIIHGIRQS